MLRVDLLQDGEIYCLLACACTFQPGNFTGWDNEAVKYKINNNNNKKEEEEEERNLRDTVDGTDKATGKQMILKVEHSAGTAFVSYDGDAHTVGRDVGLKHNALGHSDPLKHNTLSNTMHSDTQTLSNTIHSDT